MTATAVAMAALAAEAVAASAMALTAGTIGTVVISVKAAPLTWQNICNRGESDLTTVSAYDIKADCVQYGKKQTIDAGPTGNI